MRRFPAAVLILSAAACLRASAAPPGGGPPEAAVDFARDIKPLLNAKCASCHGGVKRAGNISYLSLEGASAAGKSGKVALKPGDADGSEMIRRVTSTDEEERMPPADHAPRLEAREVELLRRWISEGAPWSKHWAYVKPEAAPLPVVANAGWPKQDMDRFVLARLEAENLAPSREADQLAWLRRVSFDLTGLPPSEEESRAFLADVSPAAYGTVVDRLLASPRYGERWAAVWLDLARCADTVGYERDPNRAVWPWRDWVVAAYNEDLPYDQFLTKQLAGDLLPDATIGDKLATVFHRNTQTNTECGTDDEEFRTIAVIDRINTTWEGIMATSFRCVQCHSHPYDPIGHDEFYRFAALFNTTQDNDSNEDFPHLAAPVRREDWPRADGLDRESRRLKREIHAAGAALAEKTPWQALRASSAKSTGRTTMEVVEHEGTPEVTASGNVQLGAVFTLEFPLAGPRFTALRIEALPFDAARAASLSELGFVLSKLRAEIVSGNQTTAVSFAAVYDDDPDAFYPAEASLNDDLPGWCGYPRFNRKRTAVFVPGEPLPLADGSVLRLTMEQKAQSTGITAQVIRRGRYAASSDEAWPALVKSQAEARQRLASLTKERAGIASVNVPVCREQNPAQRRDTHVFVRGNFLDQGPAVAPGVPAVLGGAEVHDRLELARWMTSPDHPLTARAAVNRVWEQLFGRGLVEIMEDFGSAGQPPSHPALFDWLAVRYATTLGWSQKRLLRELVLSATYRQDATVRPDLLDHDPFNRLLARGPRTRLSAEMVRDQALAVSGLLSLKTGGPPVMPQQPEGIWRTVYNGGRWATSPGEDAHRRSVYTFVRRTSGYPGYLTFDAPSREVCAVRRIATNTPLQALVTLNDPVYIEAAAALADRMAAGGGELSEQLARGFQIATGRAVSKEMLPPLLALHAQALQKFTADSKAAASFAGPAGKAALAVTANALLNLDAVLTK